MSTKPKITQILYRSYITVRTEDGSTYRIEGSEDAGFSVTKSIHGYQTPISAFDQSDLMEKIGEVPRKWLREGSDNADRSARPKETPCAEHPGGVSLEDA